MGREGERESLSCRTDRVAIESALITQLICLSRRKVLNQRLRVFIWPRADILDEKRSSSQRGEQRAEKGGE